MRRRIAGASPLGSALAAAVSIGAVGFALALLSGALPPTDGELAGAGTLMQIREGALGLLQSCSASLAEASAGCGFTALVLPLVDLAGPTGSARAVSVLGGLALVAAALFATRELGRELGLDPALWALCVLAALLNPIAIGAFRSGDASAACAAAALTGLVWSQRALDSSARPLAVCARVSCAQTAAILLHSLGIICLAATVAYVATRRALPGVGQPERSAAPLAVALCAPALLAVSLLLAPWAGVGGGALPPGLVAYPQALTLSGAAVSVALGPLLLVVLRMHLVVSDIPLLAGLAVYVHAVIVFFGREFDARHFLFAFPLVGIFVLRGLNEAPKRLRDWATVAFVVANGLTVVLFASPLGIPAQRLIPDSLAGLHLADLAAQSRQAALFTRLDDLPARAEVVLVSCAATAAAAEWVYRFPGHAYIRPDLAASETCQPPAIDSVPEGTVLVYLGGKEPLSTRQPGVAPLGDGAFRVVERGPS